MLSMFALLLGCGFEPLYMQHSIGGQQYGKNKQTISVAADMALIKVEPIADRFGQLMRNNLLDLLTPKGIPHNPKYRLEVTLISRNIVQQAMRRDITATNERVAYNVGYKMFDENKKQVLQGKSVAFVSYDIMDNPFSTTMAQKKTENDAAKIIAEDISLRIAAYFYSKQ